MKQLSALRCRLSTALVLGIAVVLSGCPCLGPNKIIFRDRALESAVRAELGQPFGCLNRQELLRVIELQAGQLAINSLEGLEYCENLLLANLSQNNIRSITPLAGLVNLTYLDLSHNEISNIEALSGLFYLQTLLLEGNLSIVDWTPLTANVANGGFPEGGTVTVSAAAVMDQDDNLLPGFQQAQTALNAAGVNVLIIGTR
jgi:hypothetical protein